MHDGGLGECECDGENADHESHAEGVGEKYGGAGEKTGRSEGTSGDGEERSDGAGKRRCRVGNAEEEHRRESAIAAAFLEFGNAEDDLASAQKRDTEGEESKADDDCDPGEMLFDRQCKGSDDKSEEAEHGDEAAGERGRNAQRAYDSVGATGAMIGSEKGRQVGGEDRKSARVNGGGRTGSEGEGIGTVENG